MAWIVVRLIPEIFSIFRISAFSFTPLSNVKEMIERDEGIFCLIDCGFDLVAELTKASSEKLGIKKGKEIYCLVKSKGIDMIHHYMS